MKEKISNLGEIKEESNRPPNLMDYVLLEKLGDNIPTDKHEYYDLISSSKRTEEYINAISNISNREAKKVEDSLIQDNVLYAIENSKYYLNKYKEALRKDPDELVKWIKKNINTGEDVEQLPSLTNEDIRKERLYPYGWWIPKKRLAKVFQSGGSTGKPSYIPYSGTDYEIACLVISEGLKKYMNVKEGNKQLFLVPPEPHPYGPVYSDSLKKIGGIPIWKHFRSFSTEQILEQIKEVNPDTLVTAPHGSKGAAGALDVLLKTDQEKGTEILPTYLEDKKIISGGAPISKELVEELYEDIGVKEIVSGYGSTQVMTYCGKPISKERNDKVEFFSEVNIPSGYWVVTPIEDEEAPENWNGYAITVLGREAMPIIKFDPGDYGKVDLENREIEDICRKEWFHQKKDGSYEVRIPSEVYTCVSEV